MLLLDTCTLVWLDTQPDLISPDARKAISEQAGSIWVSSISALEIAVKVRKGKMVLQMAPRDWFPAVLAAHGLRELPLEHRVAVESALLPALHSGPFDRILVATAQLMDESIVIPDSFIRAYPGTKVIW